MIATITCDFKPEVSSICKSFKVSFPLIVFCKAFAIFSLFLICPSHGFPKTPPGAFKIAFLSIDSMVDKNGEGLAVRLAICPSSNIASSSLPSESVCSAGRASSSWSLSQNSIAFSNSRLAEFDARQEICSQLKAARTMKSNLVIIFRTRPSKEEGIPLQIQIKV